MSLHVDCPACEGGNHDGHNVTWGVQPGLIGGTVCGCPGDCAERATARTAEMLRRLPMPDPVTAVPSPQITDWEPHCSDRYIRGMRAALLYVTGEAHEPLWAAALADPAPARDRRRRMTLPGIVATEPLLIDVAGEPITQGSMIAVKRGARTFVVPDNSTELRHWRQAIIDKAQTAMRLAGLTRPLDGELRLDVDFFMRRPPSVKRHRPTVPPDGDKCLRAVADALKLAGAIVDDARIVSWHADQWYAQETPGARIVVQVIG